MGFLNRLFSLLFAGPTSGPSRSVPGFRLGLRLHRMWYVARNLARFYREFDLPCPNGKTRPISAPIGPLAFIQRRILRRVLDRVPLHDAAHGFRRGRSIVTNAGPHVGKEVVFSVDIKDFFPTITFPRVFGVFHSLGFQKTRAGLLARLCTLRGSLPQGAPTSPALANIVCRRLDNRLSCLAAKSGLAYTRYADDLTFSGRADAVSILPLVAKIVKEEGFTLNRDKTRIMRRNGCQEVTGLVVNDKVSIPRRWRRRLRAALHNQRQGRSSDPVNVLGGRAAFLYMVQPDACARLASKSARDAG